MFSRLSLSHLGAGVTSTRVACRVVFPLNSGVGEPFTIPPNAGFFIGYVGFFGQCEKGICVFLALSLSSPFLLRHTDVI